MHRGRLKHQLPSTSRASKSKDGQWQAHFWLKFLHLIESTMKLKIGQDMLGQKENIWWSNEDNLVCLHNSQGTFAV